VVASSAQEEAAALASSSVEAKQTRLDRAALDFATGSRAGRTPPFVGGRFGSGGRGFCCTGCVGAVPLLRRVIGREVASTISSHGSDSDDTGVSSRSIDLLLLNPTSAIAGRSLDVRGVGSLDPLFIVSSSRMSGPRFGFGLGLRFPPSVPSPSRLAHFTQWIAYERFGVPHLGHSKALESYVR
jgi:hypothetical protein